MTGLDMAAGVTGLISLGIQVTQSLVDFYSAYKNRQAEIAFTVKRLEGLLDVLESLPSGLTARRFRTDEQDLLTTIKNSVEACEECIQELRIEVEKFKRKPTGNFGNAARTLARQAAYPFRQSTLQGLDENIAEIVSQLSLAVQALQQTTTARIQDDIEDIKALLALVRADQVSSTVCDWLKAPDATINYNEHCKKFHPGTGLWFVQGPPFNTWLKEPYSFLWLNGFAGCGKSVLCSTAIRYAYRHRRSSSRIGPAFFFFTFNDDAKQDSSAMLRALILQLSGQLNDNNEILSRFYTSYRNSTPPDEALIDCLRQLVRAFDDVYIFLDALDESPRNKHRKDTLQTLTDLWAWSEPGLHLLVTSRNEVDISQVIRDELHLAADKVIGLNNHFIDDDIESFVSGHLEASRWMRRWADHRNQIKEALVERANGVYVLHLACYNIC